MNRKAKLTHPDVENRQDGDYVGEGKLEYHGKYRNGRWMTIYQGRVRRWQKLENAIAHLKEIQSRSES